MSKRRWEEELSDELQFHLEMLTGENIRAGMNPEEARRCAILRLGGLTQIEEEVREQRFAFWVETLWKDTLYGIRMLRKSYSISAVSLLTLALAIGACIALFSIWNGIVLRPLPYPHSARIVQIRESNLSKGVPPSEVSARNVDDWKTLSTLFEGIAAYGTIGRTLTTNNESEVVLASQVSADFFRVFGTQPLMGRVFTEEESQRAHFSLAMAIVSADPTVILSYRLWMRRFGSDPSVIGKTIFLDRKPYRVIGVMPRQFAMPDAKTALWIPWGIRFEFRDQHFAGAVGTLRAGVSLEQAEQQLNSIAGQMAQQFPQSNQGWKVHLAWLQDSVTGDFKQILWFLLSAVAIVLLIACVNIAIVQLSKASARVQETSVRMALGASRFRLIRQYFLEGSLLAFAGGILGFAFADLGIAALRRAEPDLPRVMEIKIDGTAVLVAILLMTIAAIVCGFAPSLIATAQRHLLFSNEGVRSTSRGSTQRIRNSLVVIEIALSLVLLSSSGMLIRSFLRLESADFGFHPHDVLVVPIFLDDEKYDSGAKTRAYYAELIERLQQLPNVISVGGATALPASPLGDDFHRPVWRMGELPQEQNKTQADVRMVTPDYFKTLGVSILRGRSFSSQDGPGAPKVAMISETLAKRVFRGEDSVGKKIVLDYSTSGTFPFEVVGVVHDIRFHGPRSLPRPEIYLPHAQRSYLILDIAIRSKNDPRVLIPSVRDVLRSIDPQKPANTISTLEDLLGNTVIRDRYAMILVSCFAFVSLMLASLGIYGVLSFFVRQKIPEIGIRLALGAQQHQIVAWIRNQGARLVVAGLIVGFVGSLVFSRLLSGILFEVSSRDVASLIAAIFVIACTAIAAAWIPALRASKVDPNTALRSL